MILIKYVSPWDICGQVIWYYRSKEELAQTRGNLSFPAYAYTISMDDTEARNLLKAQDLVSQYQKNNKAEEL